MTKCQNEERPYSYYSWCCGHSSVDTCAIWFNPIFRLHLKWQLHCRAAFIFCSPSTEGAKAAYQLLKTLPSLASVKASHCQIRRATNLCRADIGGCTRLTMEWIREVGISPSGFGLCFWGKRHRTKSCFILQMQMTWKGSFWHWPTVCSSALGSQVWTLLLSMVRRAG